MAKRCERMNFERCPWAKSELYVQYHDTEWGVPVHDDGDILLLGIRVRES